MLCRSIICSSQICVFLFVVVQQVLAVAEPGSCISSGSASDVGSCRQPLAVQLQRVDGGKGSHFYVGRLSIGKPEPQVLQVLFDTASGHVLLPHKMCKSPACQKHRSYSPWKSSTAWDINATGKALDQDHRLVPDTAVRDAVTVEFAQADLGDGKASAILVRDQVCLGSEFSSQVCTEVDVMAALQMEEEFFSDMPFDGMLGLGLGGLSTEPGCSFFSRLLDHTPGLLPQFGLSLGAQSGEIYFGGHDSSKLAAPLTWFPVLFPEEGFWEVAIKAVRLGNQTLDNCIDGCRGIVDTGASHLGVHPNRFDVLSRALAVAAPGQGGGCQGENLEIDLGNFLLILPVMDYAAGPACKPQLGSLPLGPDEFKGVYALGESVLRRYYTAFDWQAKRMGFAPASTRRVQFGAGSRQARQEFAV